MQNTIDFTKTGGMPLDQSILSFLQKNTEHTVAVLESLFGSNNLILSGVVETDNVLSPGYILIAGKLRVFGGGTKSTHIKVVDTGTYKTYADGQSHKVVTNYVAIPHTEGTLLTAFTRISTYKQLMDAVAKIALGQQTISSSASGYEHNLTFSRAIADQIAINGYLNISCEDIDVYGQQTFSLNNPTGFNFATQGLYKNMAFMRHNTSGVLTPMPITIECDQNKVYIYFASSAPTAPENYSLIANISIIAQ